MDSNQIGEQKWLKIIFPSLPWAIGCDGDSVSTREMYECMINTNENSLPTANTIRRRKITISAILITNFIWILVFFLRGCFWWGATSLTSCATFPNTKYPWRVPSIAVNVFRLHFHKLALFAGSDSTTENSVPKFAKKCGKKALAAFHKLQVEIITKTKRSTCFWTCHNHGVSFDDCSLCC